jgi:hypothetical protein
MPPPTTSVTTAFIHQYHAAPLKPAPSAWVTIRTNTAAGRNANPFVSGRWMPLATARSSTSASEMKAKPRMRRTAVSGTGGWPVMLVMAVGASA